MATTSNEDAQRITAAAVLPQPLRNKLAALLGNRFTTTLSVREQYGRGESYPHLHIPDAVAFPTSTGVFNKMRKAPRTRAACWPEIVERKVEPLVADFARTEPTP